MEALSVVDFLTSLPLLQGLERSFLEKIAKIVTFMNYDCGEYVIGQGVAGLGIYFIWDGEADACGDFRHVIDESPDEFHLKRHDYFGHGISSSDQHGEVISLTKLTCLVLPHKHWCMLPQFNSSPNCNLQQILNLQPIRESIFQGVTLPEAPAFTGRVFGGQFIGQALVAAHRTVDPLMIVHSLNANFLIAGDVDLPVAYEVIRARDGKRFSSRRVDATQNGKLVFSLTASFQKEDGEIEHQYALMPSVPDPDTLLSIDEIRQRRLIDPRLPRTYRNKLATTKHIPWPVEVRFCDPDKIATRYTKTPPSLRFWFRAKDKLCDDQSLHRCAVAYVSDLMISNIIPNPHRKKDLTIAPSTLNHSMWFHRDVRADDWLLHLVHTPSAYKSRGFVKSQIFNMNGQLVASVGQEAALTFLKPREPKMQSKM
ncbi:unnamed protein product [Cuscuta europaea]|uniref:Cyclic nucleotide-binding domain-containing protein n=1 Tax=Cuscuta europaea TaxID=41803 RepID=A0A9P0ZBD9_CUSEU|nr:unnamed protein product [Cuscuta europaea]